MAQVILNWLNKDLKIPRKVKSIENDFASGILFAQIFRKLKPQIDISAYSDKNSAENFSLLVPLLNEYKVQYDNNLLNDIIFKQRGAALRILFQLRQIIQKSRPKPGKTGSLSQKTRQINEKVGTSVLGRLKQYGEKLNAEQAGTKMRTLIFKKQKDQNLIERMAPFQEELIRQANKALNDKQIQEIQHSAYLQEKRQEHLSLIQRNKQLMQDWQTKNIENWKKSMRDKRDMLARQKYFRELEVQKHKNNIKRLMTEANEEMIGGIDAFQKNLARQGIDINARRDEASASGPPPPVDFSTLNRSNIRYMNPKQMLGNFSAVACMNKIKQSKHVTDHARKERDKLRTKLQVQQERAKQLLEANKHQQSLVEKYITQIESQKQENFMSYRAQHYKNAEKINRENKAKDLQDDFKRVVAQLQEQDAANFKDLAKQRAQIYSRQKLEYRQTNIQRREQKISKHTKQCKKITNLIVDVALAAFDARCLQIQEARSELGQNFITEEPPVMTPDWRDQKIKMSQAGKIDIKKWRVWMERFKEGVNIFDQQVDQLAAVSQLLKGMSADNSREEQQEYDELAEVCDSTQGDSISLQQRAKICEVGARAVDEVQYVDYVSGLGLWDQSGLLKQEISYEGSKELGMIISNLIENNFQEEEDNKKKLVEELVNELPPNDLTFKICINGPLLTGKTTQANFLKDKYPQLLVIQPQKLIKDLILLTDPVKKDQEAPADAKGKKKQAPPAKKGKQVVQDPLVVLMQEFENTEYLRLCNRIRQQLVQDRHGKFSIHEAASQNLEELKLGQDQNQEGQRPFTVGQVFDLISPTNMSKLIVGRIKHHFTKKSEEQSDQQPPEQILREKIRRQKEILEQLQKLAQQAAAIANDPKGKKPPALKPGQKSPQQLLQDQLEEIRTPKLNGWVVVGYPNNLEQTTTLISMLSNFEQPAFKEESNLQLFRHTANSIVELQQKRDQEESLIKKQPLVECGIDAMISLLGSTSESIRRAQGRMLDPATGIVYHMEDNPPPANIQSDKLVPFQYEQGGINHQPEAISRSFQNWNREFKAFENCMRQFGINQRFPALYVENGGTGAETKIDTVRERVDGIVGGLLEVRKEMLQEIKQKLREQMKEEQKQTEKQEFEAKEAPPEAAQGQDKKQQAAQDEQNGIKEQQQQKVQQQKIPQDSTEQESSRKIISKHSFTHNNYMQLENLFQQWNKLSLKYISLSKKQLNRLSTHQLTIINGMTTLQQRFASYLSRSDQKQVMMDQFIQNYQQIVDSHQNYAMEESTIQGILAMVQRLGDDLWDIIQKRKNQAEDERFRIMSAGWVKKQLNKLLSIYHKLAGIEFLKAKGNKFEYNLHILALLSIAQQYYGQYSSDPAQFDYQQLVPRLSQIPIFKPEQEQDINNGNMTSFELPQIVAVDTTLLTQVQEIFRQFQSGTPLYDFVKDPSNINNFKNCLSEMKASILKKAKLLKSWFIRQIRQIMSLSTKIYAKMDDWIVKAVYEENKQIRKATKILEACVLRGERELPQTTGIQLRVGPVRIDAFELMPLDSTGLSSRKSTGMLPRLGSQAGAFLYGGFNIQKLRNIVFKLESNANDYNYITRRKTFKFFIQLAVSYVNQRLFTQRMNKSKQELPDSWSGMSSAMFRMLIVALDPQNNGYIKWRSLSTYLCLLKSSLPLSMELNYYRNALKQNSIQIRQELTQQSKLYTQGQQKSIDQVASINKSSLLSFRTVAREDVFISYDKFIQVPAWFDQTEKDEKIKSRVTDIKKLLFEINKEPSIRGADDKMHIDNFLRIVSGSEYIKRNKSSAVLVGEGGESPTAAPRGKHKSYYELLFEFI